MEREWKEEINGKEKERERRSKGEGKVTARQWTGGRRVREMQGKDNGKVMER